MSVTEVCREERGERRTDLSVHCMEDKVGGGKLEEEEDDKERRKKERKEGRRGRR